MRLVVNDPDDIEVAIGNVTILVSALAEASVNCCLFGDETQAVVSLCDEISFSQSEREL